MSAHGEIISCRIIHNLPTVDYIIFNTTQDGNVMTVLINNMNTNLSLYFRLHWYKFQISTPGTSHDHMYRRDSTRAVLVAGVLG